MALSPADPSSYSRPDICRVTGIHLNLNVNFEEHILDGYVDLTIEQVQKEAKSLLLDTRDLIIGDVKDADSGATLEFKHCEPELDFGSKLEVFIGSSVKKVRIAYRTSPQCTALQWLKPAQTAGGKQPYMFSQCQAIHCRSMLPCQDSPGVKMPYSAEMTHPGHLTCLMSAIADGKPSPLDGGDLTVTCFKQDVPVPSYLIAVVVGSLKSRDLGPRVRVWCEEEQLEAAAYEFAETETTLKIAEDYCGPYVWTRYDLLVLPPSFPYGGMENPCISFMTPTMMAGDRSLVSLLVHELTHSWTGNLVTNKSPEDFWLNEGHTVYIERKIIGIMSGEKIRQFEAVGGYSELENQVNNIFNPTHPFTVLVPDLKGINPDDAFSTVPYEKGCALLMYLEQILGGPAVFDAFIKAYIDNFKYKSITTQDWKDYLYKFFADKKDILDTVDWNTWFYKPGMPPVKADYDRTLANACESLANKWSEAGEDLSNFTTSDMGEMSPFQVKEFLSILSDKGNVTEAKLEKLESLHKFYSIRNCEIRLKWLHLCLKTKQKSAIQKALDFVNEQGRMKFVRPIYRDLYEWEESKELAINNYKKYASNMHNLTASMLAKDLKLN